MSTHLDPAGILLPLIMISPILLAPFRRRPGAASLLTLPSWCIRAAVGPRLSLQSWSSLRTDHQCLFDALLWAALAYEALKAAGLSH